LAVEGFRRTDRDILVDDPRAHRPVPAVSLAEGLEEGSEAEVLGAWQWLGNRPEITNRLQGWLGGVWRN
jgi:hypothetical protein